MAITGKTGMSQARNFLNGQIHFVASMTRNVIIGLILCIYLSFVIIVLQPFDTSQFEAEYKTVLLSGYGILVFVVYVIHARIEQIRYERSGKVWLAKSEITSVLLFCVFAGTVLYGYNRSIVNGGLDYTLATYWRFLRVTVLYMLPVIIPPMVYLRQKFGERIVPPEPDLVVLSGENKNEILHVKRGELLFVRAVENYVEICYVDCGKAVSKTFRQTLSDVNRQAPFLEKCHRSYLVNTAMIDEILGNSQSSKIVFAIGGKEIPLSKSYYKHIKNILSGRNVIASSKKVVVSSNSV